MGSSFQYVAEEIRLASLAEHNDYKHPAEATPRTLSDTTDTSVAL